VSERRLDEAFALAYESFAPREEGLREALTSTGNGYFCTRGAAEWQDADGVHYPGTYAHGVYKRETTVMGGRPVLNEDLVNLPNWLVLKLRIEGDDAIGLDNVELPDYRHEYDIRYALLSRTVRFRDRAGRETSLRSRRFVSMAHHHQATIEWVITPENWSGRMEVVTAIDGRVTNRGVTRYAELEGRHLDPVSPRTFGPEVIALKVQTRQSSLYVAQAAPSCFAATSPSTSSAACSRRRTTSNRSSPATRARAIRCGLRRWSRSTPHATAPSANRWGVPGSPPAAVPGSSRRSSATSGRGRSCGVRATCGCRGTIASNSCCASTSPMSCKSVRATRPIGTPVSQRGVSTARHIVGHVFWDELYVYPFLNFRLPNITRALLMYRFRRSGQARAAARDAGYAGAMYPWQSGSDGREETQVVHLNPLSGRWEPDLSHNQRHVNAAIFYNIWSYYEVTEDLNFLREYGAEMMLEIARFWASIASFNPDRDRYEIHGVMGPDEFHEKYPDAAEGGLRNNAYTNVMVAWIAETARKVLALLPESRREALSARLGLTDEEIAGWDEMSRKMFVPFHDDGVISQFEGYEKLAELDWDAYRAKYDRIQRLDRILRAEGDDPDRYMLAKQADTVMLFYLFSEGQLRHLFERLGYEFGPETARKNIAYYDARTSHGSTLSFITHAAVLAALDPESSWDRFMVAIESDIGDVQGGTTQEGIHLGVMSGTLDLIQRGYIGSDIRDGVLHFSPRLTERLDGLSFPMQFRGTPTRVTLADGGLTVAVHAEGFSRPIRVAVGDEVRELRAGDQHTFALKATTSGTQ
jgi:trehalose/maltose hydrolase-like predicted phosphorylase